MIPPHQIVRNHYLHFSSLQIHVHITPLNNSPTINICWWSTTGEIQFWLVKSLFRHMFTGENQPKTSKSLGFIWWNPSNNQKKKTMGSSGYGSIPIDTFLVGWTSIYQLFWGSLGTRVLTHPHLGSSGILSPIRSHRPGGVPPTERLRWRPGRSDAAPRQPGLGDAPAAWRRDLGGFCILKLQTVIGWCYNYIYIMVDPIMMVDVI